MDWKETDERLIRRGELILDLKALENHGKELENMNEGRPGPRYKLANSYIQLLAAVRYLFQMPYRQLEGYTRILHMLVQELPQADYSGIRKRILRHIPVIQGAQGRYSKAAAPKDQDDRPVPHAPGGVGHRVNLTLDRDVLGHLPVPRRNELALLT